MTKSSFVYVTYIRTTPENLWEALTDSQFVRKYWFGATIECGWKKGAPWKMLFPDGRVADTGEILEIDPPRRVGDSLAQRAEARVQGGGTDWLHR